MGRSLLALGLAGLLAAGCSRTAPEPANEAAPPPAPPAGNVAVPPRLDPPAPGEPGGLADDRTPVSEAPFSETSAQGAAMVVQTYFALVEAGRFGDAWRLWSEGGAASGMSEADFAAGFGRYREYHAQVGAPGPIEGAAGSLYVTVPIQLYGTLAGGQAFSRTGSVTLRRANEVPGATAEQRRWRIARIALDRVP